MTALLLVLITSLTASAQTQSQMVAAAMARYCQAPPNFEVWREELHKQALASGITQATWNAASPQMSWNEDIVKLDRESAKYFSKSFFQYVSTRVTNQSLLQARSYLEWEGLKYLEDVKYGVPASILIALWGMESNFADKPDPRSPIFNVIQAMTTLAVDCRRPDMFRAHLLDALRLIQRGDYAVNSYYGQWAGEISGLQFTPSILFNYGASYDGRGFPNPAAKKEDMFATAANVLKGYGWYKGLPASQEVVLPSPWKWENYAEADAPLKTLRRMHPLSYWKSLGIKSRTGEFPNTDLHAALVLPLGYRGPAILAYYPNFNALMSWNNSLNNALTASYYANRIQDSNVLPIEKGKPAIPFLSKEEMKEVQAWLNRNRFDNTEPDGMLGSGTREGVRKAQLKAADPSMFPDGFPSKEFLDFTRRNPSL